MADGVAVAPGGEPGAGVVPPSLAVVVGRADDVGRLCRVDEPDRVLRIWALLGSAVGDLREVSLSPELIARLHRQLDVLTAELETSLSPALAGELHRLLGPEKGAEFSAGELRIQYATLLAWTASLLVEVLGQIDETGARVARAVTRPVPGERRAGPAGVRAV